MNWSMFIYAAIHSLLQFYMDWKSAVNGTSWYQMGYDKPFYLSNYIKNQNARTQIHLRWSTICTTKNPKLTIQEYIQERKWTVKSNVWRISHRITYIKHISHILSFLFKPYKAIFAAIITCHGDPQCCWEPRLQQGYFCKFGYWNVSPAVSKTFTIYSS